MFNKESLAQSEVLASIFNKVAFSISVSFDSSWYNAQHKLSVKHSSESLVHFLLVGLGINASPTPLFDPNWYKNPLTGEIDSTFAYIRFVENGWIEGNNPHPIFDVNFYASQIAENNIILPDPITHFRQSGWKEGLKPHPLFDPSFYLSQNRVEITGTDDPLSHYLRVGNRRGYVTSPHFDTAWYRAAYNNNISVQRDALVDYVTYGYAEGRKPNKAFDPSRYSELTPDLPAGTDPLTDFLKRGHTRSDCLPSGVTFYPEKGFVTSPIYLSKSSRVPLVSVIITNLNGRRHLSNLFTSLKEQTYQNFEIIFVDDGSLDDSVIEAEKHGCTRIIHLPAQIGFAAANNAGLSVARGEFLALLNNDVRVHNGWLESLVMRMVSDNMIGAVTSKVRFWGKFSRLRLTARSEFAIEREAFVQGLDYKKFFVRIGEETEQELVSAQHGEDNFIVELDVPNHQSKVVLPLTRVGAMISVIVDDIPNRQSRVCPGPGLGSLEIVLKPSRMMERSGFYVINNAGTTEDIYGMPLDRGIYEVDTGQYDIPQEIPFFCGCSVLVRRTALNGQKLFIGELVAYYEDSELSLRLRRSGFRLFYEPTSVVEHRHSSTTVEKSAFWRHHTWKNSTLFRYILSGYQTDKIIDEEILRLNHMRMWYLSQDASTEQELKFAELIPQTSDHMTSIARKLKDGSVPERNGTRTGLFNPYWNTLGGGEAHALNVANVLRNDGFVELISTEDFDLEAICEFFGVDSFPFIKRLVSEMTTEITAEYDVFINSCYQSTLLSKARKSFYILSFPSRNAPQEFVESYKFLPNSQFTRKWMLTYWSAKCVNELVVYPLVPESFYLRNGEGSIKENIILSVGRFASTGHIKNQLEIAKVFNRLTKKNLIAKDWKLVLIGTANDLDYVEKVRFCLKQTSHEIIIDAAFETVLDFYKRSKIYIHASGLNQNLQEEPERAEHFGMAVAQAMASACFPIVFNGAGPAEIVSATGIGDLFNDEQEMERVMLERCRFFEINNIVTDYLRSIVQAASIFDNHHFNARLEGEACKFNCETA